MVSGVAVVLDIVLGPAEIAPASCQPLQAAWSSLLDVRSSVCGTSWPSGSGSAYSSGDGARGGPGPLGRSAGVHIRRSGRHVEVPDPSREEVRDSGYE